jgi:hypothetical protein
MAQDVKKLNEDKMKSPLASNQKDNSLKEINEKIDNLTSLFLVRQIEDRINLMSNEIMESNKQRDQKIELLTEMIHNNNELLQDIKDLLSRNLNQTATKVEKQTLEEISGPILDESDDEIKIAPLPEKEEAEEQIQTPVVEDNKEEVHETIEELEPVQEVVEQQNEIPDTMDINQGIKVIERGQVDDLILSNATTYIKNKGDKLVINGINEEEKEEDKKSELEEAEERIEEQQNVDLSRGDITEVFEEETLTNEAPTVEGAQDIVPSEPQQVVAQESVEQPNQAAEEFPQDIENTTKYTYENIKAVKTFVERVKTINPKLASNTEADLATMPQNMKQSWDENLIVMPGVLGPQHTR